MPTSNNIWPIRLPPAKQASWVEQYRQFALRGTQIHELTGRHSDEARTGSLISAALDRAAPGAGDRVIDIGCGDGRLLDTIADKAALAAGIVPTEEERDRLAAHYAGRPIAFRAERLEELADTGERFDVILVIGVLQLLSRRSLVKEALRRIATIAAPGARVYIGELPFMPVAPKIYRSALRATGYVLRAHGPFAALRFARHIWRRRHRMGRYELRRLPVAFWATPEDFAALARDYGFVLEESWETALGGAFAAKGGTRRQDYLFTYRP